MYAINVGLVALGYAVSQVHGFWRMNCGVIERGRVDPIISPDTISGHTHTIGGAFNINTTSDYDSLQAAPCTTCDIQEDKSAYWTPLLYYQFKNGSFIPVPNSGTTVYYLGRGEDADNMIPFPEGLRMLSGSAGARAYDNTTWTYSVGSDPGRPVSDRVSFVCINYTNEVPQQPYMWDTNCPDGMRAQIQFQSCWDGVNLYKSDQSHVAYLSQIDNGYCPPSHPYLMPHLFIEMYYFPNDIDTSDNGTFVFAQGDTTGYGFHGDFMNGWNTSVLEEGIAQCINTVESGLISDCPPLQASYDPYTSINCPRRPNLVDEQIEGVLSALPGCNELTYGPAEAAQGECATKPNLIPVALNLDYTTRWIPQTNDTLGNFTYLGCATDSAGNGSPIGGISINNASLTLDGCQAYCKSKGYSLAGVEYSTYCYCSNTVLATLLEPAACAATFTMACGGNLTQTCGAPNFMHIWNDTSYSGPALKGIPVANSTMLQTSVGNATYRGCYVDNTNGRALNSASYVNTTGMTIESCASYCNSNGYTVFGTEYAQECYCGSSVPTIPASQTDCAMTCTGDTTEFCGNGNRLSVWSLSSLSVSTTANGVLPSMSGVTYMGCYSDNTGSRALANTYSVSSSAGMTIEGCAQVAQAKNLAYFGLEYASQCFAGNAIVNGTSTGQLIAPAKCNMQCQANSTEYCGGPNALSMFQNTLYAPTVIPAVANVSSSSSSNITTYAYLGCYTEGTTGRSLGSANSSTPSYSTASSLMTVEYCVTACYNKGFSYAGIEYADECYCNNAGIVNGGTKAPGGNADCNMLCAANSREYCGAGNRVQVYELILSTKASASSSSTTSTRSSTTTTTTTMTLTSSRTTSFIAANTTTIGTSATTKSSMSTSVGRNTTLSTSSIAATSSVVATNSSATTNSTVTASTVVAAASTGPNNSNATTNSTVTTNGTATTSSTGTTNSTVTASTLVTAASTGPNNSTGTSNSSSGTTNGTVTATTLVAAASTGPNNSTGTANSTVATNSTIGPSSTMASTYAAVHPAVDFAKTTTSSTFSTTHKTTTAPSTIKTTTKSSTSATVKTTTMILASSTIKTTTKTTTTTVQQTPKKTTTTSSSSFTKSTISSSFKGTTSTAQNSITLAAPQSFAQTTMISSSNGTNTTTTYTSTTFNITTTSFTSSG